jgi:Na+/H+ antiporter NhaD/arsenite permease-like protein
MTKARKKTITVVGGLAVIFAFFNVFEHSLRAAGVSIVPLWLSVPFVLFLIAIAAAPFIHKRWWEQHYPKVAASLGSFVAAYYIVGLGSWQRVFVTTHDYISFLSLIGSLYVVSGGIHFTLRGKAAPWENVLLLAGGALLSNILGTTGASMLLLRPYLRSNKYRIHGYHVVFFIFVVSNIGGALTPIGDPPLFLGYLKGVPFFWVIGKAWYAWLLVLSVVLILFWLIDKQSFRKASKRIQAQASEPEIVTFSGLHNVWFLLIILAAVFVQQPVMLREVIMWCAALASYSTTKSEVHGKNGFNFAALKEVAILFAGIFLTMIPALDWLEMNARSLGLTTPGQFFWCSGALSSVLDNAPTYLSFLSAAMGLHGGSIDNAMHMQALLGIVQTSSVGLPNPLMPDAFPMAAESWKYVQAISLGAVFFGAMTYIGNGPNFLVKSIAEQSGVECPSFIGYIWKYSIPILLPAFLLVWWLVF